MTEADKNFPTRFVYPPQKDLFLKLMETGFIGKSEEGDIFYFRLTQILSGVSSPIYKRMGWNESYAWDRALEESGLEPVGSDLGSFTVVFHALRSKQDADRIISHRKEIIEAKKIKNSL